MKKIIVLFVILSFALPSVAQHWILPFKHRYVPEHDFRIGFGIKPFETDEVFESLRNWNDIDDVYSNEIIDFDARDYSRGARYTTNSVFLEYIYQTNKWFGVGATVNYVAYFNRYYDNQTKSSVGMNLIQHVSIYPTVRFTWVNIPGFRMYSSLGLGHRLVYERDRIPTGFSTSWHSGIAGQMTLLGLTVGRKVYIFTDLCTVGSQGLLNVGIGYRMRNHRK